MPRKSKNNRKNNRNNRNRKNKRNPRRRRFRLTTSRQVGDLSDRTICVIRVSDAFTDNPVNPILKYTWVANGLFDPFGSSADAQPSWFKPWMALYSKYRVTFGSISLQCTNTTSGPPYEICVYPTVDSIIVNSVVEAKTQPYNRSRLIGPASGASNARLGNIMASNKMFGRSVMGDEGFSGDFTSNPNFKWYWQVFLSTLDGTNVLPSFVATITFRVIFYGRLSQGETSPMLAKLWDHRQSIEEKSIEYLPDVM